MPPERLRTYSAAVRDASLSEDEVVVIEHAAERSESDELARYVPRDGQLSWDSSISARLLGPISQAHKDGRVEVVEVWGENLLEAEFAFRLRHELEHVRQVRDWPELPRLHQDAVDAIGSRDHSGTWYHLIPMELDANRAASAFVKTFYETELGPRLTRPVDRAVERMDTEARLGGIDLPTRMRAFTERTCPGA